MLYFITVYLLSSPKSMCSPGKMHQLVLSTILSFMSTLDLRGHFLSRNAFFPGGALLSKFVFTRFRETLNHLLVVIFSCLIAAAVSQSSCCTGKKKKKGTEINQQWCEAVKSDPSLSNTTHFLIMVLITPDGGPSHILHKGRETKRNWLVTSHENSPYNNDFMVSLMYRLPRCHGAPLLSKNY